ncbi:MAG: phosphoribosyl-AMP cyclohydrolase [Candidatus Nanopelagicaceae bacterium]
MEIPTTIKEALAKGLIPAIAQDAKSDEVLMLAWMNEDSLKMTIESGRATYFSRSRNQIWIKGETSGHFQEVVQIAFDCDGDSVLLKVNQIGNACHTGAKTCFHNELSNDAPKRL